MNKILIGTCLLLVLASNVYCQFKVQGTVISKEEEQGIPGISIIEKGTKNGTVTDIDGSFVLEVSDSSATLVFMSVGYVTEEYPINNSDSIFIKLKPDCIRDYFDTQNITFYARSGVVNTPIGGQVDFAFPYFSQGTLITSFSYQTNFKENSFINAKAEYRHLVYNCDFDVDANWYFRKVLFDNNFESRTHSFESNFTYDGWRFVVGYSNLRFDRFEQDKELTMSAPVIGFGTWVDARTFGVMVTGKSAIYRNVTEWIGEATFHMKYIELFVNYYKLDNFSEVSIGIGKEIGYWLKSQKQYREQNK
ncbi:MAG: carboxypeptidase-like regulatory domain-containing protein [Bacteroidota bacterium]